MVTGDEFPDGARLLTISPASTLIAGNGYSRQSRMTAMIDQQRIWRAVHKPTPDAADVLRARYAHCVRQLKDSEHLLSPSGVRFMRRYAAALLFTAKDVEREGLTPIAVFFD